MADQLARVNYSVLHCEDSIKDSQPYSSLQLTEILEDLGQELLPNSSIFEVHKNYNIESLSYVEFCQEFNFED